MKILKNIGTLSCFNSLMNFRFYSVVAMLYFSQVTGSYASGISIFSIAQLSQALFEIPTGYYSDKIGRRKTLILGAFINCFSVFCYAIGQFYWILVVGAVLQGLYYSLFSGNNDALLYESLAEAGQKEKYHEVLGKQHSNVELMGFLSAVLGGLLAFKSYQLLLWLSVFPQLAALLLSLQVIEPKQPRDGVGNIFAHISEALVNFRKSTKLRYLSLANILGFAVGESSWSFQSAFYSTVLPVWAVGFVMSLNFLTSTVSFRLSGRIITRFKALNVLIFQEIYSRMLYFIALIFPTAFSPFLLASASVMYGPGVISMNTLLQSEFTNKQRATMASLNSLVGNCLFAVAAVVIGVVADTFGPAKAMLLAQVCLLPLLLIYIKVFRKKS